MPLIFSSQRLRAAAAIRSNHFLPVVVRPQFDHPGTRVQACRRLDPDSRLQSVFHVTNSKSDSAPPAPAPDFEASLAELESIVEKLEQGELSLDDSLKQFERGVQLTRICQTALTQAEQKVEILLRKSGNVAGDDAFEPAPFDADDSES